MIEDIEEPDPAGIGMRIQMIRGKMTQQEFARKIGIKQSYISRYERGRIPKPDVLLKIARFANVSIEWLLTGKEISHPDGYLNGHRPESFLELTPLDKKIVLSLTKLTESDKKILLKIIRKMLSY